MALQGDEWEISIPELAERFGRAQTQAGELLGSSLSRSSREDSAALRAILDARVSLEAAEKIGVAAVRADEAAVESAEATRQAAKAAEGTKRATVALALATFLLVVAAVIQILVQLEVFVP